MYPVLVLVRGRKRRGGIPSYSWHRVGVGEGWVYPSHPLSWLGVGYGRGEGTPPLWSDRKTDTCENITFPLYYVHGQ